MLDPAERGAGAAAPEGPAPNKSPNAALDAEQIASTPPPAAPAPSTSGAVLRAEAAAPGGVGGAAAEMSQLVVLPEDAGTRPDLFPQRADGGGALVDVNAQQVDLRRHNSWMLKLHEARRPAPPPSAPPCPVMHSFPRDSDDDRTGSSYSLRACPFAAGRPPPAPPPADSPAARAAQVSTGELVEVMAINAIAPAILNARLKPLLEVLPPTPTPPARSGRPQSKPTPLCAPAT